MDERKESGEFYPGGRASQGGGGSGGEGGDTAPKVPVTHVDELPERYSEGDMSAKINEIARIISGGVAALAAMVATAQATVQGARKDALYNDDFVVTNVTVALDGLVTTNQLEEARRSDGEALLQEIAEAADETRRTLISELEVATNELRTRVIGEIAGATNAVAGERATALAPYATKDWVNAQGFAEGSALEGYATQGWVAEQGYAPKSWVEGRGYMTGTNLAPYATKDWVEGRGYMTGTNLAPYATRDWVEGRGYLTGTDLNGYATQDWVEGKGYVTGDEAREGIEKGAEEAIRRIAAEMDGTTAHRLMVPGAWEWIDGTGAIWRVCSAVEWRGETLTGDMGATNWIGQGWSVGWEPGEEEAEVGTWRMRNVLSEAGPLEVEWIGEQLPYGEGGWKLQADKVELNGSEVTPGQIRENGWYQIADENDALHYVSPLVTTVTVARVTNAVDRLTRFEEMSATLDNATNIANSATNVLTRAEAIAGYTEWTFTGTPPESGKSYEMLFESLNGDWWLIYSGADPEEDPLVQESGSIDDVEVSFSGEGGFSVTATRHRITPTALSQLTNDVGYATTNYVDNALTNRPTKAEVDAGWWSEWMATIVDAENIVVTGLPYYQPEDDQHTESHGWYLPTSQRDVYFGVYDIDAVSLSFNEHVDDWYLHYTATRHRAAAPVPTKISDLPNDTGYVTSSITNGLARLTDIAPTVSNTVTKSYVESLGIESGVDAQTVTNMTSLTPVYSQTPTFSEWVCEPAEADGVPFKLVGDGLEGTYWMLVWGSSQHAQGYSDSTSLTWDAEGDRPAVTATRVRTDIIGYTLGTQTKSVLAATNSLISASTITNIASTVSSSAIASADTTYRRTIGITNLNQSVQYVNVTDATPSTLAISIPTDGATKDWMVYVVSVTNVTLSLPAATWWMADVAYTNDVPPATPTALWFSQVTDGVFLLGRQELTPVSIEGGN